MCCVHHACVIRSERAECCLEGLAYSSLSQANASPGFHSIDQITGAGAGAETPAVTQVINNYYFYT